MSDERLVRLANFRLVVEKRRLTPAELGRQFENRPSFWGELLKGEKSFGEKLARRIEEVLRLPLKWLDTPQTSAAQVIPFRDLNAIESHHLTLFRLLDETNQAEVIADVNARLKPKRRLDDEFRPGAVRLPPDGEVRSGMLQNAHQKRRPPPKPKRSK